MNPPIVALAAGMRTSFTAFVRKQSIGGTEAEDIVQDFYVRVIRHADEVIEEANARAWLFRVLRTTVFDYYRREERRAEGLRACAADDSQTRSEATASGCDCLHEILLSLRKPYADIIEQIDLNDEEFESVALRSHTTASNLRVRRFRAHGALRARLAERCTSCPSRS